MFQNTKLQHYLSFFPFMIEYQCACSQVTPQYSVFSIPFRVDFMISSTICPFSATILDVVLFNF